MTGKRATDMGSPGFVAFLVFVLAVYVAITAYLPAPEIKTAEPVDKCVDGIVQSWDGNRWHPVTIDRKSHHYNGKKWVSDHPVGHVRTIPCGDKK